MTLQSSGAIDVKAIEGEFDGAGSVTPDPIFDIRYYYRNGPFVSSNNTSIPISGPISFANFYGATNNDAVVIISSTTTNVNAQTLFGANWTNAAVRKRLIISPNVIVGGVYPSPALTIPSGLANNLYIINYGSITGYGGEGSTYKILSGSSAGATYGYSTGQNGGDAISASSSNVYILNYGTIYAGGGGGGTPTTQTTTTTVLSGGANINNVTVALTRYDRPAGGTGVGYNNATNTTSSIKSRYSLTFTNTVASQNYNLIFPPNFDITITNTNSYTRKMLFSSNSSITLNQNSSGIGIINSVGCIDRGNGATTLDSPGATTDTCVYPSNTYVIGGVQISGTDSVFRWNGSSSGFRLLIKDPNQPHYAGGVLNAGGTLANNTIYSVYTTSGLQNQSNVLSLTGAWGTYSYTTPTITGPSDGGTGGDLGKPGTGTGAGLGGYYIVGNTNVNWINLGNVIGAVG